MYKFGFIVTDKNQLTWEWILALTVIDAKQRILSNSCAFSQSNGDFGLSSKWLSLQHIRFMFFFRRVYMQNSD